MSTPGKGWILEGGRKEWGWGEAGVHGSHKEEEPW